MTVIIGITGSIGTGKSATSAMFRRLGFAVQDADALVHDLLAHDVDVRQKIASLFPTAMHCGSIDRQRLRHIVFQDNNALKMLEDIIHPHVKRRFLDFIDQHKELQTSLVVLDIPLLFERSWQTFCSVTIAMYCTAELQRTRVLARPGMTEAIFDTIVMQQWSSEEKCHHATFTLDTSHGFLHTFQNLKKGLLLCNKDFALKKYSY